MMSQVSHGFYPVTIDSGLKSCLWQKCAKGGSNHLYLLGLLIWMLSLAMGKMVFADSAVFFLSKAVSGIPSTMSHSSHVQYSFPDIAIVFDGLSRCSLVQLIGVNQNRH